MFMKDEIDGILYTIPSESVVWRHETAMSRVQWPQWVDYVVNSKRDVYAFTNAEMIMSIAGSAAPTCILKHHSGKGYVYAQILEIDTVSTEYMQHGVTNKTIGSLLLWPLSYNQHTVVWNKISDETAANSALRTFPPIEPDFLTLTNEGRFSGPETRPRPCVIEGAYTTRIADETSASDRLAVLLSATSRFLFRDGKARNERYRRATRRYIEDLPDRQAHKNQLASQSRKRQREDKQQMKALYENGNMSAFIKNIPCVIKDLRVISGMPIASQCSVKCMRKLEHGSTNYEYESKSRMTLFGDNTNSLPCDIQAKVIRTCACSILSDSDIDRSRQHAYELSAVSKKTRSILFMEMASFITKTCERVVECVRFGSVNNPAIMSRLTYTTLSCSPLLLLELATRYNLRNTSHSDVVRLYYEARSFANTCKQVCAARAKPNEGVSALTAVRSISSIDFNQEITTHKPKAVRGSEDLVKMTPRFEELWYTFNGR
jgi:hypothetical protein